ncbi:MAG TPA: ATP-grasp domain-containing protein [Longimicrobiaceae bacterium]
MNVLVTDGEQRAALAIVRSLGRAGHRVNVCAARSRSLAGASKYCAAHERVPDPLHKPEAFAAAVEELAARWAADVILPVSEPALLAILPVRERFAPARIPFPSYDSFRRISDKALVAEAAERVGIRIPAQRVLAAPPDAVDGIRFPLVVKPSRSVAEGDGERIKLSVAFADDAVALGRILAEMPRGAYPLLLQERIDGPGVGVFLLVRGSRVVAAFAHRRIREKPPAGGVSVYRESAHLDPGLLERSRALLAEFGWEGVAMVEYKLDAAGTPYLMEVNGRFWGSLQLAIDAGVDFPRLLVEGAEANGAPPPWRVGVRSLWEWGDVDHLIARLCRSARELALPPGAPGRARAVADFLRALGPGSRNEVLRASDPAPFIRETVDWLHRR